MLDLRSSLVIETMTIQPFIVFIQEEKRTMAMKVVGTRAGTTAATLENANTLLKTMQRLRGSKGICPRGVYRFKTFEEADEWMMKMLAQSTRANQQ
ncbi:MAG: hypothetical protein ONB46_15350 [candidate division KSB1 bacterium]|nr:hypothetical protein [candidate division KSB1 bacterium]MDZ7367094.1 hypothetical protein [candidate division KSB1 bacterium]MDZ7405072.1 hypothetical protein [candidate division KSB1 bacterium]